MADYPALPLWTDRYLSDTRHLPDAAHHGAYLLLLMEAWRRQTCSLPDDDAILARLAACSPEEWARVKPLVMSFWRLDRRRKEWTQKGLTRERSFLQDRTQRQVDRARKRWKSTKNDDAAAMPENARGIAPAYAPTPTPTPREEVLNPVVALPSGKESPGGEGGLGGDFPEAHAPEAASGASAGKPASPRSRKVSGGTRLQDDWALPEDWQKWAIAEGLTQAEADREAAKFADWWHAASGARATKRDWAATWRVWVRREIDRRRDMPHPRRPPDDAARLRAHGIEVAHADPVGPAPVARYIGSGRAWDATDRLPPVQPAPPEEDRPLPLGDVRGRRGSLELLALRLEGSCA